MPPEPRWHFPFRLCLFFHCGDVWAVSVGRAFAQTYQRSSWRSFCHLLTESNSHECNNRKTRCTWLLLQRLVSGVRALVKSLLQENFIIIIKYFHLLLLLSLNLALMASFASRQHHLKWHSSSSLATVHFCAVAVDEIANEINAIPSARRACIWVREPYFIWKNIKPNLCLIRLQVASVASTRYLFAVAFPLVCFAGE